MPLPIERTVYLNALGMLNALGDDPETVYSNLVKGKSPGMGISKSPILGKEFYVGQVQCPLPEVQSEYAEFDCRNNQLASAALKQIAEQIESAKQKYGENRVGVVIGTSTSGIDEAEIALKQLNESGQLPKDYTYKKQEIGAVAEFVSLIAGVRGPAYVISTACSSSGKVFASARSLIQQDICDAVIVGGVDSLCELTLSGFASLEAVSGELTNPFSENRQGINIGEAAALFLMSKEPSNICLMGVGESSDAHHMSAPEPSGAGALAAMKSALSDASITVDDVDYINLHGTGTQLNDAMESHAVAALFGDSVPASSTKPLTGHTLGAAGATEAGIGWLLLNYTEHFKLAPHIYDGQFDPKLSKIRLCESSAAQSRVKTVLSNSFAFGGNNVSVILGLSQLEGLDYGSLK